MDDEGTEALEAVDGMIHAGQIHNCNHNYTRKIVGAVIGNLRQG